MINWMTRPVGTDASTGSVDRALYPFRLLTQKFLGCSVNLQ